MSVSLPRAASAPTITTLSFDEEWLFLDWEDGASSRFPAVWLRDNLPEGRHSAEGQRTFDIASLPAHIELGDAVLAEDGRLFDVVTQEKPSNLAYTGLALGLHTDNPYRDPVPGLQLLHCLEAGAEGGESLAVDGLAVAERLRIEAPEDFALLTRHAVPFRYLDRAAGVDLSARAPLIELDDEGAVAAVRYNNRSAAPFDLAPELLPDFYRAYRRFGRMLHEPGQRVSFRLAPGDLFAVDNRRVLHGRTGFGGGAGGRRHLQGCYADRDSLRSCLAILDATLEEA